MTDKVKKSDQKDVKLDQPAAADNITVFELTNKNSPTVLVIPSPVLSSTRKLSQDELAKVERIRLKLLGKVQTEAKLKSIFIKLDFDHNGMMSKKEFVKLLQAILMKNVTEKVVDMVWNAIWEQRKHGDDDEMDASTMNHWLELD